MFSGGGSQCGAVGSASGAGPVCRAKQRGFLLAGAWGERSLSGNEAACVRGRQRQGWGFFQRAGKAVAVGLHCGPRGAATGSFAGVRPGDPHAPAQGCPHLVAGGHWVPGANARPPSSSHDATTMPVVLPAHPTSQATPNFAKCAFFSALKGTETPHGKARAGTRADVQAKGKRPGTTPISSGRCRWQVPADSSSPPNSQNLPTKATLCDPPEHQRLCGAEQALLARLSVRVLAPKGTSYFHVMDVQGNVFACREGPRLAGWGGEQGLAGEVGCSGMGLEKEKRCLETGSAGPGLRLGAKLVCGCAGA